VGSVLEDLQQYRTVLELLKPLEPMVAHTYHELRLLRRTAWIHYKLGDLNAAIDLLEKGIAHAEFLRVPDPSIQDLQLTMYVLLGDFKTLQGNIDGAVVDYEAFFSRGRAFNLLSPASYGDQWQTFTEFARKHGVTIQEEVTLDNWYMGREAPPPAQDKQSIIEDMAAYSAEMSDILRDNLHSDTP